MANEFPNKFMSIRSVARTGLLPESVLRRFVVEGILPGFYTGRKYLINTDLLADMLRDPHSPFNNQGRKEGNNLDS